MRIIVTISDEQFAAVRALVRARRARNVSEFVRHAVAVGISDAAGWREMLRDALDQTGGPLTRKEKAWTDAILRRQAR